MNNYQYPQKSPLFQPILLMEIFVVFSILLGIMEIPDITIIKLIRYGVMISASFMVLRIIKRNHHIHPNLIQDIFYLWLVAIFIRSIPDILDPYNGYIALKQFLSIFLFMYTIPLFMIAKIDTNFLRKLICLSYILAIIYLLTAIPHYLMTNSPEPYMVLCEGVILLLMTLPYHKNNKNVVIIVSVTIAIILAMLAARRNKVVFFGGGLFLAVFSILTSRSKRSQKYKWILVLVLFLLFSAILIFSSSFSFFFERVGTWMDSRESIIYLFFDDFNRNPSDWIWGRGIIGQFYGGVLNTDETKELRDGIENGYLYLILKGGWMWLGLLIIISLSAIYKGFFKSKNLLCKGFAMIILLYYFDMIGFGIPSNTLKYMMVFISIAGCNTKWLRQCSDEQLSQKIGLK